MFIKRTYFEQYKTKCSLRVELEIALGLPEAHRRNLDIPGSAQEVAFLPRKFA
jgi:hypothetical protein